MNSYAVVDIETNKIPYIYSSSSNQYGNNLPEITQLVHNGYNEDKTIRWKEVKRIHPLMNFMSSNYIHIDLDANFKLVENELLIYSSNQIKLINSD